MNKNLDEYRMSVVSKFRKLCYHAVRNSVKKEIENNFIICAPHVPPCLSMKYEIRTSVVLDDNSWTECPFIKILYSPTVSCDPVRLSESVLCASSPGISCTSTHVWTVYQRCNIVEGVWDPEDISVETSSSNNVMRLDAVVTFSVTSVLLISRYNTKTVVEST